KEIALLCRKYGVLLILDEIATGFGRLGNMAEYVAQKSTPDIACFGKALTGGYFPLACVVATNEIFNAFLGDYSAGKLFYHGHTFTGHPVGCAAALANMEQYEKAGLIQKIRATGRHISSRLREFARSDLVCDIRHKGMLAGIELEANGKPVTHVGGERINYFIMRRSLEKRVFLRPLGNIMMLVPPLAIGRQDLDKIIDTHLQLLHEIERSVPHKS
ncbi:MAG TPA: aminotransferase class III-fold pyridoxal phosphate-dependent enzyme, partial [Nitrososphaera sp.]|nr:aminotransferase class III-fold pyridoxal phosphate-dependent enzyme [Nitrososphaera sp.]